MRATKPTDGDVVQKLKDLIGAIETKAEALQEDVKDSVKSKADKLKSELKDAEVKLGKKKDQALDRLADEIDGLEKEVRNLTKKK